ncbi:hypothetical protein PCANC_08258 [Puccinia coronata f. sp. avenae]|uniref:BED-type domain-containing protein n=1 Tax=Puccinia coronata f. sp. avenae TaxID=200324 RepID=A0A2N5T5T0_9BASI|nr:hypothetical protein PCANC_08258 [Puccinia coronata f. sp. avenae]
MPQGKKRPRDAPTSLFSGNARQSTACDKSPRSGKNGSNTDDDIATIDLPSATPKTTSAAAKTSTPCTATKAKRTRQTKIEESEASTKPNSKKRKTTSDVWAHFKEQGAGNNLKAICRACQQSLSGKISSGTNHLWQHLN